MIQTRKGLIVIYTVGREGDGVLHHRSVSYQGGWFARSAAGFIIAYLHGLLGLRDIPIGVSFTPERYHVVFKLTPGQQATFVPAQIQIPPLHQLPAIKEACWRNGRGMPMQPIALPG